MPHKTLSQSFELLHQGLHEADRHLVRLLARCLEAAQQAELPSPAEVRTIQQCGFPRSYHLNDGMGTELA